jgi:Transposase IS200 like
MRRMASRFGIRVYEYANASTHIHMLVRAKCRLALHGFLRAFAGLAARIVTGAGKGRPVGKFWDWLAYSRVVAWGRDFLGVRGYVLKNELETVGLLPYERKCRRPTRRGLPVSGARASPSRE